ncbi:MAG: Glu/Leu/Phe/Val dehydrogenase dimerization domain-containing protein [Pseudomonadota bacterium]
MNITDLSPEALSEFPSYDDHEHVRRFVLNDEVVAYIAVHNSNLGPSLGGCRFKPYTDEKEAINDVLRLSRGMTYKNAVAGLPLGGGKAVIIGEPKVHKTAELMQAMGEAVESFEGLYITAEDSGTNEEDMVNISQNTQFVTGLPPEKMEGSTYGELGGNPSPLTALGCYEGIKAAIEFRYKGEKSIPDLSFAVQGVGAVGFEICKLLSQDNPKITICDINDENIQAAKDAIPSLEVVDVHDIYGVDCDIFVPCAMGGVLNDNTIELLKCDIVAGMANNQLLSEHHDQMLHSKNILYVPDYVINSGGVICVGYEFFRNSGYNPQDFNIERGAMVSHVERIGKIVYEILDRAAQEGRPTGETADNIAEEKFLKGVALNDNEEEENSSQNSTKLVQ